MTNINCAGGVLDHNKLANKLLNFNDMISIMNIIYDRCIQQSWQGRVWILGGPFVLAVTKGPRSEWDIGLFVLASDLIWSGPLTKWSSWKQIEICWKFV